VDFTKKKQKYWKKKGRIVPGKFKGKKKGERCPLRSLIPRELIMEGDVSSRGGPMGSERKLCYRCPRKSTARHAVDREQELTRITTKREVREQEASTKKDLIKHTKRGHGRTFQCLRSLTQGSRGRPLCSQMRSLGGKERIEKDHVSGGKKKDKNANPPRTCLIAGVI